MKKLTKHVLIPVATFAVTVTGVSAFNSEVLEEAGLSNTQIEAFSEANELRQAGAWDEARTVLEEAGIDRETMSQVRSIMKEHRAEVRAAVEAALEDGDYDEFMTAITGTPLADAIDSEDDFEAFLEAHELRQAGDKEGARAILDELGIAKPEKGKGGKGERGDRGDRGERGDRSAA